MQVGFIGLGIMGSRMAHNLRRAGHELVVYNRTKDKAQRLLADGAKWADAPVEVAAQVPVLITMLAQPKAVESVMEHVLKKPGAVRLWVDCSTVDPAFSRRMAQQASQAGMQFLDAPVAGSKGPAEAGELLFLVGGEADALAEVQPLLEVMGKHTRYVGGHGQGASLKILVNLLLAQSMLAFSESVALGEAMGLDRQLLLEFLPALPVAAPFLQNLREKLSRGDQDVNFPLKHMRKDLHLVAQAAFENQVAMPSAGVAGAVYAEALQRGLGEADFSAIFRYLAVAES